MATSCRDINVALELIDLIFPSMSGGTTLNLTPKALSTISLASSSIPCCNPSLMPSSLIISYAGDSIMMSFPSDDKETGRQGDKVTVSLTFSCAVV